MCGYYSLSSSDLNCQVEMIKTNVNVLKNSNTIHIIYQYSIHWNNDLKQKVLGITFITYKMLLLFQLFMCGVCKICVIRCMMQWFCQSNHISLYYSILVNIYWFGVLDTINVTSIIDAIII